MTKPFADMPTSRNPVIQGNIERYFDLDPRASAEVVAPSLRSIYASTSELVSEPHHKLSLASAAIELALVQTNNKQRKMFARSAGRMLGDIINLPDSSTGRKLPGGSSEARRLLDISKLTITNTPATRADYGGKATNHLLEILDDFQSPGLTSRSVGLVAGDAMEQTVLSLMTGPAARERGLFGYVSMARHKRAAQSVGGQKYRWDMVVESTGDVLPIGQYRVQATAGGNVNDNNPYSEYHPDIAVVSGTRDLEDDPYFERRLVAARNIAEGYDSAIERHIDAVVFRLGIVGPVVPDLSLLAA